jgi:hypothetical protein
LPFWGAIIAPLKISMHRLTPTRDEIFLTHRSNGTDSKNGKISLKSGFETASCQRALSVKSVNGLKPNRLLDTHVCLYSTKFIEYGFKEG